MRPIRRSFQERSTSSPYMKKRSSKPPTRSKAARRTARQQPLRKAGAPSGGSAMSTPPRPRPGPHPLGVREGRLEAVEAVGGEVPVGVDEADQRIPPPRRRQVAGDREA